jgi:hypothetical protein
MQKHLVDWTKRLAPVLAALALILLGMRMIDGELLSVLGAALLYWALIWRQPAGPDWASLPSYERRESRARPSAARRRGALGLAAVHRDRDDEVHPVQAGKSALLYQHQGGI